MRVLGPIDVEISVQTDPTWLLYASVTIACEQQTHFPQKKREATTANASAVQRLRRPRNKRNVGSCWLKTLTGLIQTLRNKSQQNATGCANERNI